MQWFCCLLLLSLFVGVLCLPLFCYAVFSVFPNFAIILMGKRELVALTCSVFLMCVPVSVLWFFLTVPWVGLQCVIGVFPHHTHLLFLRRAVAQW